MRVDVRTEAPGDEPQEAGTVSYLKKNYTTMTCKWRTEADALIAYRCLTAFARARHRG